MHNVAPYSLPLQTMTDKTPHPHFNDRGTLHWHTSLAEARKQAAVEGKLIFIEFGREL